MNIKLTATQTTVLEAAADRADGNIEPLPSKLRGGARTAVIDGLLAKGLVTKDGDNYLLTDVGYASVGKKCPAQVGVTKRDAILKQISTPKDVGSNDTLEDVKSFDIPDGLQNLEGTRTMGTPSRISSIRSGTKLAILIDCLRQPSGATIIQLIQMTHWQSHSIRGAISGTLRKKLGLNVVLEISPSGERTYRIV